MGKIAAFVHLSELKIWVKIVDPFSILSDDISYVRYVIEDETIPSTFKRHISFLFKTIDINLLNLDMLRFDENFIRIIEDHKDSELYNFLRIENICGDKKDIAKNIIEENGVETVVVNRSYNYIRRESYDL